MRAKLLILLAILCLTLLGNVWLSLATESMEQECIQLQEELWELKVENEALACRLAELRELQAIRGEQVVYQGWSRGNSYRDKVFLTKKN